MTKKLSLTPLADRIVVSLAIPEEKTASGIIIPDASQNKEKPQQGTVVAVGPGAFNEEGERNAMSVSVGDTILFSKYSPDEVEVDGEQYLVMREDSVLAIIS